MNIPDTILKLVEEAEKQAAIVKKRTADISIAQLALLKTEARLNDAKTKYAESLLAVQQKANEEREAIPFKKRVTMASSDYWSPCKNEMLNNLKRL